MALTADQTNWFTGFWSFFQKQPRPSKAGSKRDGWDAAALTTEHGGYGGNK